MVSALVTVCDEGPGLDPADRERAFERFWRGDHARSGSGLGLAIVRATAERHGGRAFVEGACFTIELPASQRTLQLRCYTELRTLRGRIAMRYLRTLPTSRLLAALGLSLALCVAAAAGAVVASGGGGETPPPKPLAEALHDSLAGPPSTA